MKKYLSSFLENILKKKESFLFCDTFGIRFFGRLKIIQGIIFLIITR